VSDEITLTIPREREFHDVAHLVLGGLALRLNLTLENLEDLQIAVEAILERAEDDRDEVTVTMSMDDGEVHGRIGPVDLGDELTRDDGGALGLRRVLDTVVDGVEVEGEWVRFTKKVTPGG
jgi:hypothetical protein